MNAIQNYWTTLDIKKAKLVFRYRTRMSNFSENFKNSEGEKRCPLCKSHADSQSEAFNCPVVRKHIESNIKYEEIFDRNISEDLATAIEKIEKLRNN